MNSEPKGKKQMTKMTKAGILDNIAEKGKQLAQKADPDYWVITDEGFLKSASY